MSENEEKKKKERRSKAASSSPNVDDENWRVKVQRLKAVKFDDDRKNRFLEKFQETGKKILSCDYADIAACTVNYHLKNDPEFAEAYDEALERYSQSLVQRIETEAVEGRPEIRYDRETGNKISERTVFETPLRAMILKRLDPMYREKQDINLTGGGGGVLVVPATQSMDEWIEAAEKQRQKMLQDQAELAGQ